MTLTYLNVVSLVLAAVLVCALVVAYLHLRRRVRDAEGAIAVIQSDDAYVSFAPRLG